MDYQRYLALKGIKSTKISEINLKEGKTEMADLRNRPIDKSDDELIFDAPGEQWDRILPLGLWECEITQKPYPEKSKNKHTNQLIVPLEIALPDGVRKAQVYLPLEGDGISFTRLTFDDLGIEYARDSETGACKIKSLKSFVGIRCKAQVVENKFNGRTTNQIRRLYPANYIPPE
jgi:hypothetical protein